MADRGSPAGRTPSATLEGFRRQIEDVRQHTGRLLDGLSDAQFNWRPGPDRWSIAECLDHLSRSAEVYLPALDRGISEARSRGLVGGGEYRPGLLGGWLARSMEPPPRTGTRSRSSKQILPAAAQRPLAEGRAEFLRMQDELERRVSDSEGLDLRRAKVASPLMKLLRLRLGDSLAFLLAHQRRHLWQAHRVREEPRFPGA